MSPTGTDSGVSEASAALTKRKGWLVVMARALVSSVWKKESRRDRRCST
jgi:hypothetical protein